MKDYIDRLREYKSLTESEIKEICRDVTDILITEPNIVYVKTPVIVCGDLHGQFVDFLGIMEKCPEPSDCSYIFLGDYVDRGRYSLEIILMVMIYKIMYPKKVFLIRGNHEFKNINRTYGFKDEIKYKYDHLGPWHTINDVFKYFLLGCIIDNRYLCVHGGISHTITLNKLYSCNRFVDSATDSTIGDIIWSDPTPLNKTRPSPRGCGWLFSSDTLKYFLMMNNLEGIIRSHQLAIEGYKFDHDNLCVTVWSAPDYMGKCLNKASVLYLAKDEVIKVDSFIVFKAGSFQKFNNYLRNKGINRLKAEDEYE